MLESDREERLDTLFKELQDHMEAFHECFRRDDVFEKKRKLLANIRRIQLEITQAKMNGDGKENHSQPS